MGAEGALALTAGVLAGSIALIGFGIPYPFAFLANRYMIARAASATPSCTSTTEAAAWRSSSGTPKQDLRRRQQVEPSSSCASG
jgi:hypothetical protein